ncbi:MAG TPA: hypothetical protein VFB15_08075 [Candidatus Binataceae bacterium]|jgi:arsenate reductase|nr:hypothetical protein [Candidatus Binataceae bacterium]
MNPRYNVLFVCRDNAAMSLIAEALLRRFGGHDYHAFSAGIRAAAHPDALAMELLRDRRLWDPTLRSKGVTEFAHPEGPRFDFVITLGERAPAGLPRTWNGAPNMIHWRISDPLAGAQDSGRRAVTYRQTLIELETRIRLFILVHQRDGLKRAARAA